MTTPLEAANDAVTAAEAVVWGERATNADAFEAAIAGLVAAVEARTREHVAQEIEAADLLALIEEFVDPDPCWYDHHGYCQAHGWFDTEPTCPHARAKELLAQRESGETT